MEPRPTVYAIRLQRHAQSQHFHIKRQLLFASKCTEIVFYTNNVPSVLESDHSINLAGGSKLVTSLAKGLNRCKQSMAASRKYTQCIVHSGRAAKRKRSAA